MILNDDNPTKNNQNLTPECNTTSSSTLLDCDSNNSTIAAGGDNIISELHSSPDDAPKLKRQCTLRNIADCVADCLEEVVTIIVAAAAAETETEPRPDELLLPNKLDSAEEKPEMVELEENNYKSSTGIFGADLIVVKLETSLVHISSHIETVLLRHTFIGSSTKSDETTINVECQGDNVIGFFNGDGNHDLKFGPNSRRLYGPVYMVRKYQSSVDEEMVYSVIIWTDATIKDKVEIEIMSIDDYFDLLQKS